MRKNQDLAEVESDKATLSITAPESGKIQISVAAGSTVKVNAIACKIDTSVEVPEEEEEDGAEDSEKEEVTDSQGKGTEKKAGAEQAAAEKSAKDKPADKDTSSPLKTTPLARSKMAAEQLSADEVLKGLKKLSSREVDTILDMRQNGDWSGSATQGTEASREQARKPMSNLRKQLSKRLVQVKNETAMLTTFNEVDMSALMDLRKKHQEAFVKKYGFKIGLISFFLKASAQALLHRPMVNSMLDGDDIITPNYVDISVAMQSPKGLMVPVIRDVHSRSLAQIEEAMQTMATKVRSGKVSLEEMTGGTFTLTNGGVFGSMMSTPLINPPQSAIIGMHNIVDRPVAINGQVEIRPMMYIALSYDHRIIDGKDSVGFLVDVKKAIENPVSLVFGGQNPEEMLLGL
ncbi:dihydrolipoyllysine-residue succinyltransferase [Geofilum rubicundum]|uniref:dihydrolipoyllysine-residue succinyltransferase n=1 Tax=Geofilum rubicundum TaxID=472113 RepID=UPI000A4B0C98|nr:dihydrolipoyllysine-residue succinyltransferase [Geofilum rubicundum]